MPKLFIYSNNRQQLQQAITVGRWFIVADAKRADAPVWVLAEGGHSHLSAQSLGYIDVSERGLWLQIIESGKETLAHVNGRPARHSALLHAGDVIHIKGAQLQLRGVCQRVIKPPRSTGDITPDLCTVLRGISGQHHGRSFTLDKPRVLGSDPDADIVLCEPAFSTQQARFERHGQRVLLRGLNLDKATDSCQVNGVPVQHCWLQPGDQIVFANNQRFMLQSPTTTPIAAKKHIPGLPLSASALHWYWLLPVAGLLGVLIAGLLLFGAR